MTRSVNFFARCGILIFLASATCCLQAELKPETIYRKVLPSVMTLEVESRDGQRYVGTAFLALADDTAITAWHVIADAQTVWAVFSDGRRVEVTAGIDKVVDCDLALVKLEMARHGRKAVLSRKVESIGSRAYVIGAPKGFGFSISDGLVSQYRSVGGISLYQVSCPISPGNSGGPILNDRGEVIGVTSWRKADAQNLAFAVPVAEFARLDRFRTPITWRKLAAPESGVAGGLPPGNGTKIVKDADSGNIDDFQKRLEKSAGKKVSVVVEENGEKQRFTFTVPREDVK